MPALLLLELQDVEVLETLEHLLRLLESSPRLKHLSLLEVQLSHSNDKIWLVDLSALEELYIESPVQYILTLLKSLPMGFKRCSVQILELLDPESDLASEAVALRLKDFDLVCDRFQNVCPTAPLIPHISLATTMYGMLLKLDAPSRWAKYEDEAHKAAGWDGIFGGLEVLSLDETLLHEVFLYTVGGAVHKLQSVNRISIQDSLPEDRFRSNLFPAGAGAFTPFIDWLSARTKAHSRISEVKLVYRQSQYYREPESEVLVENLRGRLQNEALTHAVVKEGEYKDNRAGTTIRWRPFYG